MMSVPKLRFKGFSEEWNVCKLGDLSERVTTKNKIDNKNVLTISAQLGLVSQLEYYNKSVAAKDLTGYYLLNKNDFAYNKSYSNGYPMGAIKRLDKYDKGVVSTLYICFRNKPNFNNDFAVQYFESGLHNKQIELYAQEGARNHGLLNIGVNDFFSTEIILPSLPEQEKIASFFTAVDSRLEKLKKKKELLEQYKKGVMQKIFSQELRFKDEKGKNFPDWEEKTLGEIFHFVRGPFGGALKKEIFVKEGYAVYEQFHAIYNKFNEFRYFIDSSKYDELLRFSVKPNDLIMSCSGTMGKFSIVPQNCVPGVINQALLKLTIKENYNLKFLKYTLELESNQNKILSQSGGGAIKNVVGVSELKEINFMLPPLFEQHKIADFLTALDKKIYLVNQQISKTELWKKGLLQQMFV